MKILDYIKYGVAVSYAQTIMQKEKPLNWFDYVIGVLMIIAIILAVLG